MKTLDVETARAQALAKLAELENDPNTIASRAAKKAAAQAAYEANREKECERGKAWRARDRDRELARVKAWNAQNHERRLAAHKKWKEQNPDQARAGASKYRKANPEKANAWSTRHRARKRGATGSHTGSDRLAILETQKYRCAYCRDSLKKDRGRWKNGHRRPRYHIDHIIALATNGANARANLQACCPSCNQRKHVKDPLVFARELGKLL